MARFYENFYIGISENIFITSKKNEKNPKKCDFPIDFFGKVCYYYNVKRKGNKPMKIRKVKKEIKKYLLENNLTDIRIRFENDFSFEPTENVISIATEKGSFKNLIDLTKKLGYNGNEPIRKIAFLHELGHYFTYQNFTEQQENYDKVVREHLYKAMESDNEKIVEKALKCYYNLPQEIEATRFGLKLLDN